MGQTTHVIEACHTCERVIQHIRMILVTHANESCHTCGWIDWKDDRVRVRVHSRARARDAVCIHVCPSHAHDSQICAHLENTTLLEKETQLFEEQKNITIPGAYASLPPRGTPFRLYACCFFYVWCVYICMHAHADTLIVATTSHKLLVCTRVACIMFDECFYEWLHMQIHSSLLLHRTNSLCVRVMSVLCVMRVCMNVCTCRYTHRCHPIAHTLCVYAHCMYDLLCISVSTLYALYIMYYVLCVTQKHVYISGNISVYIHTQIWCISESTLYALRVMYCMEHIYNICMYVSAHTYYVYNIRMYVSTHIYIPGKESVYIHKHV